MYCILSCEQIFTFLFQSSNHSVLLLGRSRYEEIANLSEDENGKEDVAKATEERDGVSYYTETINSIMLVEYACLRSGNKTFAQLRWYRCPLCDNRMNA